MLMRRSHLGTLGALGAFSVLHPHARVGRLMRKAAQSAQTAQQVCGDGGRSDRPSRTTPVLSMDEIENFFETAHTLAATGLPLTQMMTVDRKAASACAIGKPCSTIQNIVAKAGGRAA